MLQLFKVSIHNEDLTEHRFLACLVTCVEVVMRQEVRVDGDKPYLGHEIAFFHWGTMFDSYG